MAEIRRFAFLRHLRADRSAYILAYKRGALTASGRGLALWFLPMSTSIAELPVDDRELSFLFHGRSIDFQDITAQGVITYRVTDPEKLAERVDFTLDLRRGVHLHQPLDAIAQTLTQLAQQFAWDYFARTPIRALLTGGVAEIRERIEAGLAADAGLADMGLAIVSTRVASVQPSSDLERALETPTREAIQQAADEATFARRAQAVEKERAIAEAELQNQIELAHREEQLIAQRGQNERKRATETAEAQRIAAEAQAAQSGIRSRAKADGVRVVEGARVEAERARMDVYRELSPSVMVGLAARELAGKLHKIEHLNISPEMFGPQLLSLIEAGTRRLGDDA